METILVLLVSIVLLRHSFLTYMKDKIIKKATDMFPETGFQKSVTMDGIAGEMCISKKTIYKYFSNKESLIEEGTEVVHQNIHRLMEEVISQNHNAIAENFQMWNVQGNV